jgi:mono/diheme cytochrome c family protein
MRASLVSLVGLAVAGLVLGVAVRPAWAVKEFKEGFEAKYVKPDSQDPKDVAFREAVAQAKCSVCHVGESRKARNAYGKALGQSLRKNDKKDAEKIAKSLEKVAGMKSDPSKPDAPTFGERIAQGKLPCDGAK